MLFGCDAEIAEWVADQIPHVHGSFEPCAAIGIVSNEGALIGGVVYHDYQKESSTLQLSMAATNPMWAKRGNIIGLLDYPFNQLGVYKCWIATPLTSEHALKTFRHIGWKREAVLAHHFGPKRHAVICRMLNPDFMRLYYGKK